MEKNLSGKGGARKLVKCLVCGEIFDASLEVCPVCGVGKENFVPVEEEVQEYRKDTKNFYVVLGGGAAGFYAASAIRERDRTGSVLLISNEEYLPYNRPMLTKSFLDKLDGEQIAIQGKAWYEEKNILPLLGKTVTGIDREKKEVILNGDMRLVYSKLVYALGSECFIPPIPGHEKDGVIAIRRLADTEKICARLKEVKQAAVIGGGVLGLEAAWELRRAGCQVTVLELAPQLMGRQLDSEASRLIGQICQDKGIQVKTGVQIAEIAGQDKVTGVKLSGGEEVPAQLVVVSAGVRANIGIAQAAGIETDRAVVVNERMETSDSDIYACGDCAQYEGINYAIWPQAMEQGKTAGANAAGERLAYKTVPAALSFHGMETALFAAGDNGKREGVSYETKEIADWEKRVYQKFYFTEGKLCGVILIGDVSRMAELSEKLEKGAGKDEI